MHSDSVRSMPSLLVLLALTAGPTLAQQVYIDYDRATAFSQYKTFQFVESKDDMRDSAIGLHAQIVSQLTQIFHEGALDEAQTDPDLQVTYYSAEKERIRVNTYDLGFGYPPGWGWGPYWGPGYSYGTSTSVTTFTQGTFVIDIWDVREDRLIWRGIATDVVSDNPQKNAKRVSKAISKLAKKWEKMYPQGAAIRKYQKEGEGQS